MSAVDSPYDHFPPTKRTDGIELIKGKYYLSRNGRPATILETKIEANITDRHCFGYWVRTGEEFQWQADGGVEEYETNDDLVTEVSPDDLEPKNAERLEPGFYYWSESGLSIAKVLSKDIRRYVDANITDWEPSLGDDPCIGYWLNDGTVDAWSSDGDHLYGYSDLNLDVSSKSGENGIDWYLQRLKEEFGPDKLNEIKYWIPQGLGEDYQTTFAVAHSPPTDWIEFHGQINGLLWNLAEDYDYSVGRGSALELARIYVPSLDDNYDFQEDFPDIFNLVEALKWSERLFYPNYEDITGWKYDEELQEQCRDRDFEDLLSTLTDPL